MQKFIGFLGRFCFSIIFILAGIHQVMNWNATEQLLVNQMLDFLSKSYQHPWAHSMFDQIIPLAPTLLIVATIAEIGGALLILLGVQVRFGAFIICLFLIPTTLLFHNFWDLEGAQKELQMIMFLKNLSIFGGALLLMAFGKGSKPVRAERS